MRATGTAQWLSWRWTPFVALVLASLAFAGLTALAVPARIGADASPTAASSRFKSQLGSFAKPGGAALAQAESSEQAAPEQANPTTLVGAASDDVARIASSLSKRGFSPPLARPEAAPAAPAAAAVVPAPAPPPELAPIAEAATPAATDGSEPTR